jgi:hypothetical protein
MRLVYRSFAAAATRNAAKFPYACGGARRKDPPRPGRGMQQTHAVPRKGYAAATSRPGGAHTSTDYPNG